MVNFNPAELAAMARKDLQELAKQHGVKANMKSGHIVDALLAKNAVNSFRAEQPGTSPSLRTSPIHDIQHPGINCSTPSSTRVLRSHSSSPVSPLLRMSLERSCRLRQSQEAASPFPTKPASAQPTTPASQSRKHSPAAAHEPAKQQLSAEKVSRKSGDSTVDSATPRRISGKRASSEVCGGKDDVRNKRNRGEGVDTKAVSNASVKKCASPRAGGVQGGGKKEGRTVAAGAKKHNPAAFFAKAHEKQFAAMQGIDSGKKKRRPPSTSKSVEQASCKRTSEAPAEQKHTTSAVSSKIGDKHVERTGYKAPKPFMIKKSVKPLTTAIPFHFSSNHRQADENAGGQGHVSHRSGSVSGKHGDGGQKDTPKRGVATPRGERKSIKLDGVELKLATVGDLRRSMVHSASKAQRDSAVKLARKCLSPANR